MRLAVTGALSYIGAAWVASVWSEWPMVVSASTLALTSAWFHLSRSPLSFWADQIAIQWVAGQGLYDASLRGPCHLAAGLGVIAYSGCVYYGGRRWNALAWGPNATAWHASTQIATALVICSIYLFSSPQDK